MRKQLIKYFTILCINIMILFSCTYNVGYYKAKPPKANSFLVDTSEFAKKNKQFKPQDIRIAVMDFKSEGVSQLLANNITEIIRNELINNTAYTIVERSQIDLILKEQGFQQTGCTDVSCAVELGKLISANKILIGKVMRLDRDTFISGRIVDVQKGIGETAGTQNIDPNNQLLEEVKKFINKVSY